MKFLLSVDVEDWFQVENLKPAIPRESWEGRELRVEKNMEWILDTLIEYNARATFFILGWVAERCPGLVRRIQADGHEIASHGYGHELIYKLTPEAFREDIKRSRGILEDLTGEKIKGYRAPNFSITDFAIEVLRDEGFSYDSSLFLTMAHDRYGRLEKYPLQAKPHFELAEGFSEVTLSCLRVVGKNIPWAGGGYFRIFPYTVFKGGIPRIAKDTGVYTFYIHPWEFDPGQPRIKSIKAQYRFRHYNNLHRTKKRFTDMVKSFQFQEIRSLFASPTVDATSAVGSEADG